MHAYIVGITDSGKTLLAKRFAKDYALQGHNVIIFDPLKSADWPSSSIKYASCEKFLNDVPAFRNAYLFIDEGKTLWEFDHLKASKILYQKRHDGIYVFLISQRYNMIPPNARNMSSLIYVFRQQPEDSKILKSERHPTLINSQYLEPTEFYACNGFTTQKCRLDFTQEFPPTYKLINDGGIMEMNNG
jgi:hypothetical protein